MTIFERIPPSSDAKEGESNLIPLFGAASQAPSDSEVPPATWDSLEVVAESDVPSTRPAETPRSHPLGDFGFTGTFMSEDIVLAGSLDVTQGKVTLWAGGTQLASWRQPECQIRRLVESQFSIEADGEMITFTADDPEGLSNAIDAILVPRKVVAYSPRQSPTPKPMASPTGRVTDEARFDGENEAARALDTSFLPPASLGDHAPLEPLEEPLEPEQTATPEPPSPPAGRAHTALPEPATPPASLPQPGSTSTFLRRRIKAFEPGAAKAEAQKIESEVAVPRGAVPEANAGAPKPALSLPPSSPAPVAAYLPTPESAPTAAAAPKGGETIADRIAASAKRGYRTAKAHRWQKADIEKVAIKAGVVAAAIGILTLAALTILTLAGGFGEAEQPALAPAPTTTLPRVTATTAAAVVTTLPPPPTGLFQSGVGEFTARWNALAEQSRPELALATALTSPFVMSITPYITLEGSLNPTAGSVVLRATPTGTSEGDGQILTALGLLIGTSDPSLEGPARRALLESLGLAVQSPQLGGLDGTVSHNALTYHLVYLADQGVLELRVTPEVSTVPGTTAPGTTAP